MHGITYPLESITSSPMLRVFNEELLCLPVKQFIAECVQSFLIGLPSQALTVLLMNYMGVLAPVIAKDIKEGRKSICTAEDLCKRVKYLY